MGDTTPANGKICPLCGYVSHTGEDNCPQDGTALRVRASQALIGTVLANKYRIDSLLGSGGMGCVYKAEQLLMRRTVAVKVLHGQIQDDESRIKRFKQEGELIGRLDHPNIIRALDFDVANGQAFLVMEYVEGENLWDLMGRIGILPVSRAVKIFAQVCDALAYAHEKNIVHRDIKPSNIMLTRLEDGSDMVKLLDFGVAKLMNTGEENVPNLTKTGVVFGSPPYMSPEQCLGQTPDARSDIYSLGCVMYEVLSGCTAIDGANSLEILHKQITDAPRSFSAISPELQIPHSIESVISKALEKKPDARYQSMSALKGDLLLALDDPRFDAYGAPVSTRPRIGFEFVILAASFVLLVACAGVYFWDIEREKKTAVGTAIRPPAVKFVGFPMTPEQSHVTGSRRSVQVPFVSGADVRQIDQSIGNKDFKVALAGAKQLYEKAKSNKPLDVGMLYATLGLIERSYEGLGDLADKRKWFDDEVKSAKANHAQELAHALVPFVDEANDSIRRKAKTGGKPFVLVTGPQEVKITEQATTVIIEETPAVTNPALQNEAANN